MSPRPSAEQARVLSRLLTSPSGRLVRWPGGFWTLARSKIAQPATSWLTAVPEWYTGIGTVRAMEDRGWLRRDSKDVPAWSADRRLTDEGRRLAESLVTRGG